ncbi:hypothetical protein LCGC14_2693170, partial [marine sediment metagenome]
MIKKILLLMFCIVFLVGTISAFEFDNIKQYDEETKTITIKNSLLGIDWLSYGQVAEIKLLSNLVEVVDVGKDKEVARFEVRSFEDYNNAFKELELFDKRKGNNKFIRDYDFKVLSYEDIIVDDYDFVSVDLGNGTIINEYQIVGNHIQQKEVWTKLTPADFKKNDVLTIAIFTEVLPRDRVEWIPNFFGVRIDEWAVFVAAGVVFTDDSDNIGGGPVYTFSNQEIGTADSTRIIVVVA